MKNFNYKLVCIEMIVKLKSNKKCMEILHVSAECYPYAKVGGLADVVGTLPKYQNQLGHIAKVVVPMHRTKFLYENEWNVEHKGGFMMGDSHFE